MKIGSYNITTFQQVLAQKLLNAVLKPHWIVFSTLLLSIFCWLLPDFLGLYKGFQDYEAIDGIGVIFVFSWYFLFIFLTYISFSLGKRFPKLRGTDTIVSVRTNKIYYAYSSLALFGFFYTVYVTLKVLGISGFIYSIVSFTTNKIAYAIYQDYSVGIFSLRYVIIISFGWALYRIVVLGKRNWIDLLNLVCFIFYIAFFGRRLQLICSILIFIALANRHQSLFSHIKLARFYWLLLFGFIMLSVATLLRNYGSYANMGYSNPLTAILSNIVSYLAAPFQVSLGVGNNALDAFRGLEYRAYTDVDTTLTANAAFSEMIVRDGLAALFKVNMWAVLFGFLAGWLSKNKDNYLYTGYPILLYAFAELWRIDLFSKGIFYTLLIVSTGVPLFYVLATLVLNSKTYKKLEPN
ncbi:MAG: hypothetical protein AAF632_14990 [Bacteroidota bacterium]